MGDCSVSEYIDEFRKLFFYYTNVFTVEAKFFFKPNMANWLASYILPHNFPDLPYTML